MPSCPIAMPSVTVIVVNWRGVPPALVTPVFAALACRSSAVLHGAASFQQLTTPTSGLAMSSAVNPIAWSIARCGARSGPTVVWRLGRRALSMVGMGVCLRRPGARSKGAASMRVTVNATV